VQALGVGPRSYYDRKSGAVSKSKRKAILIEDKIRALYFDRKQRYGSPQITMDLQAQGIRVSRITVAKYMRLQANLLKL